MYTIHSIGQNKRYVTQYRVVIITEVTHFVCACTHYIIIWQEARC